MRIELNKKCYILISFLLLFINTYGQEIGSVEHPDSTTVKISPLTEKAERFLDSVFRPDPELNNADSIIRSIDRLPPFGIYKDNYFVIGTDMFKRPTRENSDVKFQVSIRQKLTNSVLPFKSYLFLTYTQVAFWDVFQESFPFRDLNFNPTIGLGRSLVYNNRFIGSIAVQFEHESNGKDEDKSRSWNKISFSTNLNMTRRWNLQAKVWIPIVDGENNSDIVHYKGWGFIASNYRFRRNLDVGLVITKRGGVNLDANIAFNVAYKPFRSSNQYLFLEYYNGYGESMLDYKQFRQRLRLGFIIKSPFGTSY